MMNGALIAASICLALAGCGLPPIVAGARFLVISESGFDVAQLDFPDQRGCMAARRAADSGAARCQRTTMWTVLLVNADAELPDGTRIEAHFRSMTDCSRPSLLRPIGATLAAPCVSAAPQRGGV